MPTLKQRKVAKTIVDSLARGETPTAIEVLKSSNYSISTSETKSTKIIQSEGVQEALEEYGFTEDNAKKVVSEIMLDSKQKGDTRINAAKEVFKVRGSYAPEKSTALNLNIGLNNLDNEVELRELAIKVREKMREEYAKVQDK